MVTANHSGADTVPNYILRTVSYLFFRLSRALGLPKTGTVEPFQAFPGLYQGCAPEEPQTIGITGANLEAYFSRFNYQGTVTFSVNRY